MPTEKSILMSAKATHDPGGKSRPAWPADSIIQADFSIQGPNSRSQTNSRTMHTDPPFAEAVPNDADRAVGSGRNIEGFGTAFPGFNWIKMAQIEG